jgi:hypothetical protein
MLIYVNRNEGLVFNEAGYEGTLEQQANDAMIHLTEDFLEFIDKTCTPRQAYMESGSDEIFGAYVDYLKENSQNWEKVEI